MPERATQETGDSVVATKTKVEPATEAVTAAQRLQEAERYLAELDHELRIGIPALEREARTKMAEAQRQGDAREANAQRQRGFDLARRNNEILTTLLPAAQAAVAERVRANLALANARAALLAA